MSIRIFKKEEYIPRSGNPVFQIHEEMDAGGGRIVTLDPRNPNAEELRNADDQFKAAQQARIASLEAELQTEKETVQALTTDLQTVTSGRDAALASVADLQGKAEELEAVKAELAAALVRIEELTPDVDPNAPFGVSKLLLRRTLRAMNLEKMLNDLLASDPTILADWTDAPYLLSNDPILVGMVPVAAGMLGKTEAEVLQLLEAARMT